MTNDILYSFRRCPYAIRVRWALLICELKVEIREIDLKNKPLDFLNKSKTKTVPILIKKDNKVIVATYGVAAVGINIPRIFNLVLLEPGKSFVRVIQSIGRGIRKAEDKDYLHVVDITSNLKYSKRHLTKRKAFYKEQGFPFQVTKVEYK